MTTLTQPQLQALRAAIDAETDVEFVGYRTNGQTGLMAGWFNQPHATVKAWNRIASWQDISNSIDFSKYTPASANLPIDVVGTNRLLSILIKLTVQQNMVLMSNQNFDAKDVGNLDALLDSVTQVPSGSGGANTAPGGANGANVANALTRPALRVEAVFGGSDVTKGTVTAKVLVREGGISDADISAALAI